MRKIVFRPLIGIEFENKCVYLGSTENELIGNIGMPEYRDGNRLFYEEIECRIDLDDAGNIEFIEYLHGLCSGKTEAEIYEIKPFDLKAEKLVELLTYENNGAVDNSEAPYCYSFKEQSIGIFRESIESDILEMIEEMKENNHYEDNKESAMTELRKAGFFGRSELE